ncbi:MAG: hypothetical protein J5I81_10660 [Nitrococcus mobilis]|nr:hypothetical protein [Nitrococcus mobilis]
MSIERVATRFAKHRSKPAPGEFQAHPPSHAHALLFAAMALRYKVLW